jgi:polyisoprenoid-binding protein YceI
MKLPSAARLAMLCALALPRLGLAAHYAVQPASTLGFTGTFQGGEFHGSFDKWNASISYDPTNLAKSKFDVSVDMTSASTGDSDRDQALPGADFFNAMAYPTARFVTSGFRRITNQHVIAEGNLTLRGVSKPLNLDITFTPQAQGATLDATGTLNRLDYGVGGGEYADTSVIGAQVKVDAHLVLMPR